MVQIFQGNLVSSGKNYAIVVARFNEFISSRLLDGAMDCLYRHGAKDENIDVAWVPGAFEIPLVAKRLARTQKYDAVICLGAIIRGSTSHFDFVSSEVSKGISNVSLNEDLPVVFGVLTTDTIEQAIERAGTKAGNKGWEAALTAIESTDLCSQIV